MAMASEGEVDDLDARSQAPTTGGATTHATDDPPPSDALSPVVSHERRSDSPPSVFDPAGERHDYETLATPLQDEDEPGTYDLKPPAPSVQHHNLEALASRLFSQDHLDLILRDPQWLARFKSFLLYYEPAWAGNLDRYLEIKKAGMAVEYANALADALHTPDGHPPLVAAHLDEQFDATTKQITEDLVDDALPAYVTYRMVQLVTDSLVKEITGTNAPVMGELIPNLAEVYCITDPSLPDNPIVYASEEFYSTTQYGRDYVIGRNCRFLQGPKSSNHAAKRLIEAVTAGQEICETILNYRRDGTPFLNLLLIAPLYDNKGTVRYFLGSQIDISPLIEDGKGLESFARLLAQDRSESRFGQRGNRDATSILEEFSRMLNDQEGGVVINPPRAESENSTRTNASKPSARNRRRVLGMDNVGDPRALWPHPNLGPSGRLPGVYQNYLLVRPYPSLRITFTSPALRIPGLLQTKFMERIGGPSHVHHGILDALRRGTGVTAKVNWLTSTRGSPSSLTDNEHRMDGRPRWIHATPMLGSDDKVGVWMIVMVEHEEVTGRLNRSPAALVTHTTSAASTAASQHPHRKLTGMSIIGEGGLMSPEGSSTPNRAASPADPATHFSARDAAKMSGRQMYAEYLRREGRDAVAERGRPGTRGTDKSLRF